MSGQDSDNKTVTAFQAYLLTEKRCTHNTFIAYKGDIDQFMQFLKEQKLVLNSVTSKHLKEFLAYLYDTGAGAKTVSRKISSLKLFYSYLAERCNFDDLGTDLYFPKVERKLPHYLSEEEIKLLLDCAEKDSSPHGIRNKVMLYLLYVSGVRISELIALTKSDVRFDEGLIIIHGKGGKQRLVPIPQPIFEIIKEYLESTHRKITKDRDAQYLFPVCYGKKIKSISRQSFWLALKDLCIRAGINRTVSPHQLRHSFATHMLRRGADLRSLQILLGHETVSTVQIYTHIEKSHLRKIYDKKHPRS